MKKVFCSFLILSLIGCAGPKRAELTTYDHICLPGETIQLRAELSSTGLFAKKLPNQKIVFYNNGASIGEGITSKKGAVSIPYKTDRNGFIQVKATLKSEQYLSESAKALLRVAPSETKFLVVDIDNTISDISPILMLLYENANIPPVKGAPETLQRLSKEYTIIYMTGRDHSLSNKTKEWLHKNNFPEGPVFFWDFLHTPLSKRKYKSELISQIGRKFQLIQIGIGNSVGDAVAYVSNGLQALILLTPEEKKRADKLPRGAKIVNSWSDIQELLF